MNEKQVREKNNIIAKETSRVPRIDVGHHGLRDLRNNQIAYSRLHDASKDKQAINDRYIRALKQLATTINELRISGYRKADSRAKDLNEEQILALIIELLAIVERLTFWLALKHREKQQ